MIQRLGRQHDRSAFECGQAMRDDWLQRHAGQFEKKDLARTYVAVRRSEVAVVGYYALCTHRVSYEFLTDEQAKGLPTIDVPVVLLGRLAVDRSAQGKGLGGLLLLDALRRAQHIADHIGIRAVEVDAIDDAAQRFYAKFGFTSLLDEPRHQFLPMHVIRKLKLAPL
jgi:GNAT superfamily N-acetyltransferase